MPTSLAEVVALVASVEVAPITDHLVAMVVATAAVEAVALIQLRMFQRTDCLQVLPVGFQVKMVQMLAPDLAS